GGLVGSAVRWKAPVAHEATSPAAIPHHQLRPDPPVVHLASKAGRELAAPSGVRRKVGETGQGVPGWKAGTMGDVLVTGATGGIGSALVAALASAGHRAIALGRDA